MSQLQDRPFHYPTTGASAYFNDVCGAGTFVNFYNINDWALNLWVTDQSEKPDDGLSVGAAYHYSSSSGFYKIISVGAGGTVYLSFPDNKYEIFAYGVQSYSYALGASANVASFAEQQDLTDIWPPDIYQGNNYSTHPWHSAEFLFSNAEQWSFWDALLGPKGFDLK